MMDDVCDVGRECVLYRIGALIEGSMILRPRRLTILLCRFCGVLTRDLRAHLWIVWSHELLDISCKMHDRHVCRYGGGSKLGGPCVV